MLCSQTLLQVAATLSLCQKLQNSKVESKTDDSPSAFLQCYNLGNDYLYACCVRVNWSRTTEQSLTTRNLTCKNRRFEQFDCLHQSHAFQNNPYYFMCKYNRQFEYCYAILTYQKGVIILSLSFVKLKKMCWFAKTDAFQVTEHVPFHFSKPLLVIIYDLETNHDCLCLD